MSYPKLRPHHRRPDILTMEVDVDISDVLSNLDTEDLLEELRYRDVKPEIMDDTHYFTLDKVVIEPMFDEYVLNKNSEKMDEMMRTFFYNVLGRIV